MQHDDLADHRVDADLRFVLETLPAGAYICDADGLITYFNRRAAEMWGREPIINDPRDRFCGSFHLFAPDGASISHDQCWMALALRDNTEFNGCEIVIERPDGERVTALAHANPLRDEAGNIIGAVNVLVDITERKTAEEARANLAAIVSSSQAAIISKTLDGIITSWNRGAERLYGYAADEVVGQSISLLLPPDRPDEFPAIMARIRRGEQVEGHETIRVAKDGRRIDVWLTVSPVRTADGRLIGASALAHDITERKRLEDAERLLADAGALLTASLESVSNLENIARLTVPILGDECVIFLREDDGTIKRVSAAGPEQSGPSTEVETLLGAPWIAQIERVILTGQSERSEISSQPQASQDTSALVIPLSARGEVLGAMVFMAKHTRRPYTAQDQALAEELGRRCAFAVDNRRLYAQAQAALRLRNEVLASVTHDLKNPLTGISLLAQTLEMQLKRGREPSFDRLTEGLRGIHERARDMASQLDELLDVAALDAGQPLDLQRNPTDLVSLARQVAMEAQATTDRHDIRVVADAAESTGDWDTVRIERVLRNLLNNAVKYSPLPGGPIEVRLANEVDGLDTWVTLTIDDHGVGIPAADLPTIFEQFHRGGNVAGRIIGTGVGLATARQIVEQHGGTISVTSREGAGTQVTVRLPLPGLNARI